jgi:cytochrome c553
MRALAVVLLLASAAWGAEGAREAYDEFYCTTCHGAQGRGNIAVAAPKLAGMEPWYLERQLLKFRRGSRGVHEHDVEGRAMQPMAAPLSNKNIERLLGWIDGWPAVAAAPTLDGDIEAGAAHYVACAGCHGARGEGQRALGAPALAGQSDWYLLTQLRNFRRGYRGQHPDDAEGALMRAPVAALPGEQAMIDVISYITQLNPGAGAAGTETDQKE